MHKELISLFDGKFVIYTYSVCVAVGLILAAVCFRILTKKLGMKDKSYDFYSFVSLLSVFLGFISAYIFQDFYDVLAGKGSHIVADFQNFFDGKGFKFSGGITFMGGLVGGAAVFIIATLLCKDKEIKAEFPLMADIAAPCILVAHGCGRIGCFFGGCCYGKVTDSFLGMNYPTALGWQKVYPTQLFEAAFCFIAFAIMMLVIFKVQKRGILLGIYAASYSVFRFFIEFLRGDYRGGADIGISPSQIQSIILILVAAAYIALKVFWWDKRKKPEEISQSQQSQQPEQSENNKK